MFETKVEEKKLSSIINSIQIALDGYDDIFSDFDPSPYGQRILSDDFIKEMQKRYIETKKGDFEVRFSLPAAFRDSKTETTIKKRLKDYFHSQMKEIESEIQKHRGMGIMRFAAGFVLLSVELLIRLYLAQQLGLELLGVILVPAGWFLMYSGLEQIFDSPYKFKDQQRFARKFHNAIYLFVSEEDVVKNIETTSDQKPLGIFVQEGGQAKPEQKPQPSKPEAKAQPKQVIKPEPPK